MAPIFSSTRIRASVALLVSLWSTAAAAQTPTPPPPAIQPTPAPDASTTQPGGATPQTQASPQQAAPTPAPAQPSDEELANKTRFRFAIHLLGGPWFVPDRTGGAGGAGIQLGAQINDLFGVYYSGTGAMGFAGSDDKAGIGGSWGVWVYNSVMADVTLFRLLQIGAGPSLDSLAFASADLKAPAPGSPAGSVKGASLGGTFFGLQTRVGIALGAKKPGKAGRFMLGLEIHATFAEIVPISTFLTIGGGQF